MRNKSQHSDIFGLFPALGVCTANLDSSRSLPKNLKFEVATYDPGLAIGKKNCDPQFGLLKWSSQDQDLMCG